MELIKIKMELQAAPPVPDLPPIIEDKVDQKPSCGCPECCSVDDRATPWDDEASTGWEAAGTKVTSYLFAQEHWLTVCIIGEET